MATKAKAETAVQISAPKIETAEFKIAGTAPYVQLRFSEKAMNTMAEKMMLGSQAGKKRAKEARDFDDDFRQAMHYSEEGWNGIPAGAFRNGLISACRLVGFKMTLAKLSVFVLPDGRGQAGAGDDARAERDGGRGPAGAGEVLAVEREFADSV
jgi:hypothetical protein